ncbi:MAG: type II secretion system protein GspD [Deltaproteobacteria bacterium CG23_combo_of_CG06-09_8_20_14_all_51_20]|nr:MAG: type II secretion system protein GspD [Deltaproteobacteria bacterium CG23_combo_of_CG06-09_8_20_14_all_51_20]
MTKITDKLIIFCVVFFVALAFSGYAGEAHRIEDDGVKADGSGDVKTVKAEKELEKPSFVDDTGEFEIVNTPFGYIKRRIKKAESVPVAPAVPAHEAPSPSPPESKVSGKTATPPESVPSPTEALKKTIEKIPEGKGGIIFNFDDADIYEVIRTISELLRINYIIDPDVRGKVTIHTTRALDKKDLFPVFHQILEANGLATVREGAVHKIISAKNVSRMPIALHSGRDMDDIPPAERVIIQVIPLKFIAAQEMTKLLTPFVSNEGAIIADAGSNTLLVVDKGINILKVLKLADTFDVNLLEKVNHRFYFFKNIDAEDAAKTLKEIASSYPTSGSDKISLIAISRLNAILAIGHHAEMLDAFVSRLDVPSEDVEPRIHVYSVKNGEAAQLGSLLNTIFGKGGKVSKATPKDKATSKGFVHPNPLAIGSGKKEPEKAEQKEAVQGETSGNVSSSATGEIKITPDEVRNSLIIEATPRDYKIVSGILERLDVLPRQVLIEATVAEITLGRDLEMGIEWTFKKEPWTETGSLSATIGAAGLNYAIGLTERWQATLSALEQDKRVNILSSPHVLASDNKEAKIAISTEIPVASTSYTSVTTNSNNILETNIQYRDTGVILTVIPHINEGGLVTMDISQEVSEQSANVSVAGKSYPSFYKRSINTTLTVKHGQTLVIGGLIKETESDSMAGVPWLSRIPLLRYFFGKDIKGKSKTEMIVMITPRVIINLEDVDAVTEEFKKKISKVKEKIENRGSKKNNK